MKKKFAKVLSALMVVIMLVAIAPTASAFDTSSYKVGDIISFGSYPQSEVTDSELISKLETAGESCSWTDYGYYAGTGSYADGEMNKVEGMMLYKDISLDGNKYRAVKINQYRPWRTSDISSSDFSYQDENGYYSGEAYYFKYEPLTWRVLDPDEGYVMCTSIIDAAAYQNFVCQKGSEYFNGNFGKKYASDWATSSLRHWLNNDFYNTAFTAKEKAQIGFSHLENTSTKSSAYNSKNTHDKIFVISYFDAVNTDYGFSSSYDTLDAARQLKGSDYAKCQGLWARSGEDGTSWWSLRSPYDSYSAGNVSPDGRAYYSAVVNGTSAGIVPAFKFNPTTGNKVCDWFYSVFSKIINWFVELFDAVC